MSNAQFVSAMTLLERNNLIAALAHNGVLLSDISITELTHMLFVRRNAARYVSAEHTV